MVAAGRGLTLDSLARSRHLLGTRLWKSFRDKGLGFIDVGSLGGVHPITEPAASLVQALCFEPDEQSFRALEKRYASPTPYASVKVMREALGGAPATGRNLYVTRVPTNTSLLEPNPRFVERYGAERFQVERVIETATSRLDDIVFSEALAKLPFGEFIKLDTQGSEHEILSGAVRTLKDRCVAVLCEVEFFQVYRGQKTLSDVDILLRDIGFSLYGIYPHYRSTKSLDPADYHTQERLMWADAVFFKDPFDDLNAGRPSSRRAIDCLIIVALLTGFYDFGIEVIRKCVTEAEGRDSLIELAREAARAEAKAVLQEFRSWTTETQRDPSYLQIRKFVDRNASNSNADFYIDGS